MCNEDHGDPFFSVQSLDGFHDISASHRVKHGSRLVQYDALRLHSQYPCNGNTLFLTAGELRGGMGSIFTHTHRCQSFIHTFADFFWFHAHILGAESNVFFYHRCYQLVIGILEYHPRCLADFPNQFVIFCIHIIHPKGTACGLHKRVDMFRKGRFPGAVMSQHRHKITFVDFDVYVFQGRNLFFHCAMIRFQNPYIFVSQIFGLHHFHRFFVHLFPPRKICFSHSYSLW